MGSFEFINLQYFNSNFMNLKVARLVLNSKCKIVVVKIGFVNEKLISCKIFRDFLQMLKSSKVPNVGFCTLCKHFFENFSEAKLALSIIRAFYWHFPGKLKLFLQNTEIKVIFYEKMKLTSSLNVTSSFKNH